ncbi:peptide transport system ATP-binding SapF domain protein, partial [Vibrio parahaemolyticus VP2007-007]
QAAHVKQKACFHAGFFYWVKRVKAD